MAVVTCSSEERGWRRPEVDFVFFWGPGRVSRRSHNFFRYFFAWRRRGTGCALGSGEEGAAFGTRAAHPQRRYTTPDEQGMACNHSFLQRSTAPPSAGAIFAPPSKKPSVLTMKKKIQK